MGKMVLSGSGSQQENHQGVKFPGCSSVCTNEFTSSEEGPGQPDLLGDTPTGLRITLSRTMAQCGFPLAAHRKESAQIVWWLEAVLGPEVHGSLVPRAQEECSPRGRAWRGLSLWKLLPRVWGQVGSGTPAVAARGCGCRGTETCNPQHSWGLSNPVTT